MSGTSIRRAIALVGLVLTVSPVALHAQKKSRDLITREEIMKSAQKDADLATAIKALRPHFFEAPRGLRSLGGTFTAQLAVYVDKIRQPGADVLQTIMAKDVADVKYLDPNRSQNEYGITANGGAIVVRKNAYVSVVDSAKEAKRPPQ